MTIPAFAWNSRYETGLDIVDEQHQRLVELLNELGKLYAAEASTEEVLRVFDALAAYTVYHFQTEEGLMAEMTVSEGHRQSHLAAHANFINQVGKARSLLSQDEMQSLAQLLTFLTRWLVDHILGIDRRMVAEVLALRAHMPPAEACRIADEETADVTSVLLEATTGLYDELAARTHEYQRANLELEHEVAERRLAESELQRHRDHLEELVLSRTEELARALEAAESANHAKSTFLANISHEMRTPLHHIKGFASLLRREVQTDKGCSYLDGLEEAAKRLLGFVSDILDIAHIEAKTFEIKLSSFDLRHVLAQMIPELRARASGKDLELVYQVANDIPDKVIGDPQRLAQILRHLLENAIKFSSRGTITMSVSLVEPGNDRHSIHFAIQDEGIGIPDEQQKDLFQLFQQGDGSSTRKQGGIGLGLAFCERLVALMKGKIGFSSSLGQGSLFWFSLPLPPSPTDNKPDHDIQTLQEG